MDLTECSTKVAPRRRVSRTVKPRALGAVGAWRSSVWLVMCNDSCQRSVTEPPTTRGTEETPRSRDHDTATFRATVHRRLGEVVSCLPWSFAPGKLGNESRQPQFRDFFGHHIPNITRRHVKASPSILFCDNNLQFAVTIRLRSPRYIFAAFLLHFHPDASSPSAVDHRTFSANLGEAILAVPVRDRPPSSAYL
jgi:hypothetical protein